MRRRECDLVARLACEVEDVRELLGLLGKIMHGVGVVPHDAEVGGGTLHGGETADRLIGVGHTRGVGILGDAEHALMEGSEATRRSTSSMSGPVSVIRTGMFSMPRSSVRPK